MKAKLILENGEVFVGKYFAGEGNITIGEVVFNTAMTGYQEIISDPSYNEQIVCMTYTQIGNYGVNDKDMESDSIQVKGFIVREYHEFYSNNEAQSSLKALLNRYNVVAIEGIDTRKLTRMIRIKGAMKGIIVPFDFDYDEAVKRLAKYPDMSGRALVGNVSTSNIIEYKAKNTKYRIAALDGGIKQNIINEFNMRGADIVVLPYNTDVNKAMDMGIDGLFLSNGPGDPMPLKGMIENVREFLGKVPIFGICLGHQILALAAGADTYKMKFGHRGANHPVINYETNIVEITSQNHGFAVDEKSLPSDIIITHKNLNDNTIEGIEIKKRKAFSVQYHPESSPGPHDSKYLFDRFLSML